MKKIIFISFIVSFLSLLLFITINFVQAAPDIGIDDKGLARQIAGRAGYEPAGVNDTTLSQSIGRVIKIALSLAGTVFLVLTIYAGILWMTASGNEEQVEKAKNIITRATMGLILIIAGYGLTVFILLTVATSTGVSGAEVGGASIGAGGFWNSFGTQFKAHWSEYIFP